MPSVTAHESTHPRDREGGYPAPNTIPLIKRHICTRRVMKEWPLVCIRAWALSHILPASPFLAVTSTFDHGGTSGWRPLNIERGHRGHESREGDLERHTSQGRFWFR